MRIGIEISTLLNHGHDIGAGRYIFNLVNNVLAVGGNNQYTLAARYLTEGHLEKTAAWRGDNVRRKFFRTSEKSLKAWDRAGFPPYELLGFKADVFHCPDFMIPPTFNKNIVLTINDLAFIRFPEFNFEWFIKKYTRQVKANAKRASKIIAISKSTKKDIMDFFKVPRDKVHVIYPAADAVFKKLNHPDSSVFDRYQIGEEFILSVGTIEPRKNYPLLIDAFAKIKADHPKLKLAIVGRTGWKSEASYKAREDSPHKEDIFFLGHVQDSDLVHLYNQARAFVYPSLFEGFGLPVLEAMSCGLPVIASNTSSLPEVVGQAGILLDPNRSSYLAEAIHKLLTINSLREELSEKGLNQAESFSWIENASQTLKLYGSATKK